MECRKGMGKLAFRYQKGHSNYFEQTHPKADSFKYFKGFLSEKFRKSRSVGQYERHTIFFGKYTKGVPFLSKMVYERVRVWTSGRSLGRIKLC